MVLEYARLCGNVAKAYREYEVLRSSFYEWKKTFNVQGEVGLVSKKPIARKHPRQFPPEVVENILCLRLFQAAIDRIAYNPEVISRMSPEGGITPDERDVLAIFFSAHNYWLTVSITVLPIGPVARDKEVTIVNRGNNFKCS